MDFVSSTVFSIRAVTGNGGGAEKVFASVVCALASKGIELDVLAFDEPKPTFFSFEDVPIVSLDIVDPNKSVSVFEFLKVVIQLRKLFKSNKKLLVVAFMHSTYIPVLLASLGLRIRIVCVEHASVEYIESGIFLKLMRSFSNCFCYKKIFVSSGQMSSQELSDPSKFMIIQNPIDPVFLSPDNMLCTKRKLRNCSTNASLRLLFVGTLRMEKNLESLLVALSSFKFQNVFTLDVIGDGPLRENLSRLTTGLGLNSMVVFHGAMESSRIREFYDCSDICVIPSFYESFSLVALESLARGVPVLSFSRCSGVAEHVIHGVNGFLIDSDVLESDSSALTVALEALSLRDFVANLAEGASSFNVSRFSIEGITDQWIQLIEDCQT